MQGEKSKLPHNYEVVECTFLMQFNYFVVVRRFLSNFLRILFGVIHVQLLRSYKIKLIGY